MEEVRYILCIWATANSDNYFRYRYFGISDRYGVYLSDRLDGDVIYFDSLESLNKNKERYLKDLKDVIEFYEMNMKVDYNKIGYKKITASKVELFINSFK